MTTGTNLISRVRTNINESSTANDPQRTDAEILVWLEDAQNEFVNRVPGDSVPELIVNGTFTGSTFAIPAGFIRFYQALLTHTISGTYTAIDPCYMLAVGDGYLAEKYIGGVGAWAQFRDNKLAFGPNPISGTVTYLGKPTTLSATTITFALGAEHEEPIVNKATSMALMKINDADAEFYGGKFESAIEAENDRWADLKAERVG